MRGSLTCFYGERYSKNDHSGCQGTVFRVVVYFRCVQTSRPASGRARFTARVRGSAAVRQNRPYRRNPPPIPIRAACLRQTAPDAGLRRYLKPAFCRTQRGGRPLVAPTTHIANKPSNTYDFRGANCHTLAKNIHYLYAQTSPVFVVRR